MDKFHPHIHALASDGLFRGSCAFYVILNVSITSLLEIFSAHVFAMLKKEWRIGDELINQLISWEHSGFSVHKGVRIATDDEEGKEALAQYTFGNRSLLEKLIYIQEAAKVIRKTYEDYHFHYRSHDYI